LKILSKQIFLPSSGVPYQQYDMDYGYHLCFGSGGFYGLSAVIILVDVIKHVIQSLMKRKTKVIPIRNPNEDSRD